MQGFSNTNPRSNNKSSLADLVDVYDLPDGEYLQVRQIGPVYCNKLHWFRIQTDRKEIKRFPKLCLDYNPETDKDDKEVCPYCKEEVPASKQYLMNAIIRDLQENKPRKQAPMTKSEQKWTKMLGYRCRLKRKESKTWTPVRVIRVPSSMCEELRSLIPLNKDKKGKVHEINDPVFGIDVNLMWDSRQKGVAAYKAQRDRRTRLSEEELEYLIYRLNVLKPETPEQAKKEWKNIEPRYLGPENNPVKKIRKDKNEDDYYDDKLKKKKSKTKKHDQDNYDQELSLDDIKPKKKKKVATLRSSKRIR